MIKNHRVCATIEARMAATRLPGKVMLPIQGLPILEHIVRRLRLSCYLDQVIVATTNQPEDDLVADLAIDAGYSVFRGSVDNIAERIYQASKGFDIIVQATGDNPLIDFNMVDSMLVVLEKQAADAICNNDPEFFPRGMDVKIFKRSALEKVLMLTKDPIDLVHGSYFIFRHPELFSIIKYNGEDEFFNFPQLRLTVDEPADYKLVKHIYDALYPNCHQFGLTEIIRYIRENPDLLTWNSTVRQKCPTEG